MRCERNDSKMKEININIKGYNVNGICVGCLNYDRKMFYHGEIHECFKNLANIDVPDGLSIQVCWECLAAVQKTNQFRQQIQKAYDVLMDYSRQHTFLNSPADLSQYAVQHLSSTKPDIISTDKLELEPIMELEMDIKRELDSEKGFELEQLDSIDLKLETDYNQDAISDFPEAELEPNISQSKSKDKEIKEEHPKGSRKLKNLPENQMSQASAGEPEPQRSGSKVHPGKALVAGFPSSYTPSGMLRIKESKTGIIFERVLKPFQPLNTPVMVSPSAFTMSSGTRKRKAAKMSQASADEPEPQPSGSKVNPEKALVVGSPSSYTPGGTLRLNESKTVITFERVLKPFRPPNTPVMVSPPASSMSPGIRKRKAAKMVGTTVGSSKPRRHQRHRRISEVLSGSEEYSASDEDDEQRKIIYEDEEDLVTPSVGRDVRKAMSRLRDIEMDGIECEVYEAWKEYNVDIALTDRKERTDEGLGMNLERDESMVNMSDVGVIGNGVVGVVDESEVGAVASENEIGVDESKRAREGSARGQGDVRSRANKLSPFTWSDDYSTYHAQQETYKRTSGPTIATTDPVDIFLSIWDRDVMSMIVEETDRYAWQIISAQSETEGGIPASLEWDVTSVEEMYRMFAIIILMSFCVKGNMHDYWTTGILEMPKFRAIMPRNRFLTLLRFIHFVDNEFQPSDLSMSQAKMYKIQPIIDHCNKKFSALYVPGQFLSLDESLLMWKGHPSFVQCMRTKAARFGIKSFELCDSVTGYLLRTILYGRKGTTSTEGPSNATAKVVLQLMQGYLDCGHCLVMDNWYNQLFLTRFLKERETDVVGTMNQRQIHVPPAIKDLSPSSLERGATVAQHCGDISLIAWMDVKLVTTVSTYHDNGTIMERRAGKDIPKPVVVEDHNKFMAGVDFKDRVLSMYLTERKGGSKWYVKVFKRMINTSLLNSYIIYKANVSRQSNAKAMTHRKFREAVVEGLLQRFPNHSDLSVQRAQARGAREHAAAVRHVDLHLHRSVRTALVPGTNTHCQKRCAQCSSEGRRHMVRWMCEMCNVPLQPGDCFSKYHGQ